MSIGNGSTTAGGHRKRHHTRYNSRCSTGESSQRSVPETEAVSEEEAVQLRPFFSFTTFFLQSDNPQIFEWVFKKEIGRGSMSRVFLAQNCETGEYGAAKVYNKILLCRQTLGNEEPPYLAVQREIEIMTGITHRFVLPIIEVIEDDYSNSLIIMMPYAEHGTLQSYIEKNQVGEATLSTCFYQIAEALRAIHEKNIVHRDIKPENILVFSDTQFFLSDFSVSTALTSPDEMLVDTRGSPAFLSPEECGGDAFSPKPADVWAYGVSLFSSVFHQLPFKLDKGQGKTVANTVFSVTQLLKAEELVFPPDNKASDELISILKRLLVKNAAQRPTFEELLKDKWFAVAKAKDDANMRLQTEMAQNRK